MTCASSKAMRYWSEMGPTTPTASRQKAWKLLSCSSSFTNGCAGPSPTAASITNPMLDIDQAVASRPPTIVPMRQFRKSSKPGNVMISYRNLNTIVVVDRESKKIVWKANMTIGQHNVHMLPVGVPGTGNVLVFDNGGIPPNANPQRAFARPNSRVLEINPLTMAIVSEYNAEKSGRPIWTFFSHFISSAQRQPNGN